ncbi:MAG: hypothetical protein J5564_08650, partial [Clostridia bacterium]|nr:hypothetical protein [Clostridia bacterium]
MADRNGSDKRRPGAGFYSLRFQVMAIVVLCYLFPATVFGIFTQTVLMKSLRQKTEAALVTGADHAWTLT